MVIFNSYVKLPEGKSESPLNHPWIAMKFGKTMVDPWGPAWHPAAPLWLVVAATQLTLLATWRHGIARWLSHTGMTSLWDSNPEVFCGITYGYNSDWYIPDSETQLLIVIYVGFSNQIVIIIVVIMNSDFLVINTWLTMSFTPPMTSWEW